MHNDKGRLGLGGCERVSKVFFYFVEGFLTCCIPFGYFFATFLGWVHRSLSIINGLIYHTWPRRSLTSLSCLDNTISTIALILEESTSTPLELTPYPKIFLDVTPKAYFCGVQTHVVPS